MKTIDMDALAEKMYADWCESAHSALPPWAHAGDDIRGRFYRMAKVARDYMTGADQTFGPNEPDLG